MENSLKGFDAIISEDLYLVGLLCSVSKEFVGKINPEFVLPLDYKKIAEK